MSTDRPTADHGAAGFCTDHGQPPDERAETVARVIAEHWPYYDRCRCQWRATGDVSQTAVDHRAHQAAAVVAALDGELNREAYLVGETDLNAARAALDRVRALFSGGPDTPCRTVWRVPMVPGREVEYVEVPMADLRAALDPEEPR